MINISIIFALVILTLVSLRAQHAARNVQEAPTDSRSFLPVWNRAGFKTQQNGHTYEA